MLTLIGRPGLAGFLCLHVLLFCCGAKAQSPAGSETDEEELLQGISLASEEEEGEDAGRLEALGQMLSDRLDLNLLTRDELSVLQLLTDKQLDAFFQYREERGPFLSLYELQAVPGLDLPVIRRILPFVMLREKGESMTRGFKAPDHSYLLVRSGRVPEQQKGFTPADSAGRSVSRYAGNPWFAYARFRYARSGAYSVGVTLEKDSGERWRWLPRRQVFGADFVSFHLQVQNRGRLKNLVIGDFQAQAGQSLVLGAGISLGKGTEIIGSTYRSTLGLRPYTAAGETGYFRGAAATLAVARALQATVFLSFARRDAVLEGGDPPVATSYATSGLHRTETERGRQGNAAERNIGVHLLYAARQSRFRAGFTALRTGYSIPLQKKPYPYNLYEFTGRSNLVAGLHANGRWKIFHWSAEAARSGSGGIGWVGSIAAALGKNLDLCFLKRQYDVDFHSFYSHAFGEGSRTINEAGSYWGIRFVPRKKWSTGGYFDYFRFPWLRYQVNAPSQGSGYLLFVKWAPRKNTKWQAVMTSERKEKNDTGRPVPVIPLYTTVRHTFQLTFEHQRPLKFSMRTRLQATGVRAGEGAGSSGVAVIQDGSVRRGRLELSGRLAWFSTDDYDSRQFTFEKDVPYAFSFPSFYGRGVRYYLVGGYRVRKDLRLWVRWAQSRYAGRESVGSGLDEITGRRKSEIKIQAMYRF